MKKKVYVRACAGWQVLEWWLSTGTTFHVHSRLFTPFHAYSNTPRREGLRAFAPLREIRVKTHLSFRQPTSGYARLHQPRSAKFDPPLVVGSGKWLKLRPWIHTVKLATVLNPTQSQSTPLKPSQRGWGKGVTASRPPGQRPSKHVGGEFTEWTPPRPSRTVTKARAVKPCQPWSSAVKPGQGGFEKKRLFIFLCATLALFPIWLPSFHSFCPKLCVSVTLWQNPKKSRGSDRFPTATNQNLMNQNLCTPTRNGSPVNRIS